MGECFLALQPSACNCVLPQHHHIVPPHSDLCMRQLQLKLSFSSYALLHFLQTWQVGSNLFRFLILSRRLVRISISWIWRSTFPVFSLFRQSSSLFFWRNSLFFFCMRLRWSSWTQYCLSILCYSVFSLWPKSLAVLTAFSNWSVILRRSSICSRSSFSTFYFSTS